MPSLVYSSSSLMFCLSSSYYFSVTHDWNLKRSTLMKMNNNNNISRERRSESNNRICLCGGVRGGVHLLSAKCNSNSSSNSEDSSSPGGGFGQSHTTFNDKKKKKKNSNTKTNTNYAPGFSLSSPAGLPDSTTNRLRTTNTSTSSPDFQFEQRLQAIKRSALEQKKLNQQTTTQFGAIDYDQPPPQPNTNSRDAPKPISLATKIGVGVAVVIFGLVFALGDFLPTTPSDSPNNKADVVDSQLSAEEKKTLQARLQQFKAVLTATPKDSTAVEGAAVTLAELGEYSSSASLLEDLTKMKSKDPDAFRLLGEVKYQLKDYEASAAAYKTAAMVSKTVNFEVVRGLTNALLAGKRPEEAVQVLLVTRERLSENRMAEGSPQDAKSEVMDPVQVELLLGKAYSDWGHVSDAVSVYDQLISTHPDDFRGYLAKGIILKENGRAGDAERMFIQARFFAPVKAKALVDRYSRT